MLDAAATVVRFVFDASVDDETVRLLEKALRNPIPADEIAAANQDAAELRAEFTGMMSRQFEGYEESYRALRAGHQSTKRLRDRTEWILRTQFNRYYADQFVQGKRLAGSGKGLDPAEREIVRRLANNEAQYALNTLLDAQTGEYKMPLDRRGALYGNALDELKWLGFLYGDLSQDRFVKWQIGDSEHCVDCLFIAGELGLFEEEIVTRAERRTSGQPTEAEQALLDLVDAHRDDQGGRWGTGVYRAQELVRMAIVPQSGRLACTTNCKCHLEPAERPAGQSRQREQREAFQSLAPKLPTMIRREKAKGKRTRLAERAGKWVHKHVRRKQPEKL